MAQIKGTAIRGALKYVKESGFPGGIPAIVVELPEAVQSIYDRKILTSEWYPYEAYTELLRLVDRRLGRGDLSLMPELGLFAAHQDVGTVLKIVSIFTSVQSLLHRGPFFWSRYCDEGEPELVDSSKTSMTMALKEFPEIAPEHCHLLTGWLEGLARSVGAHTAAATKTHCVHRGDPWCQYDGRWG